MKVSELERVLANTLNQFAKRDGLLKTYDNGMELHRCKKCRAYHSGNHICKEK